MDEDQNIKHPPEDQEGNSAAVAKRRNFKSVNAAISTVRVLRHLAHETRPLGVSAIARDLGLYPGTTYNLLQTLVTQGYVMFDDRAKTYRLGFGVLELAHGLLRSTGYIDVVRPRLRDTSETHGVTTYLFRVLGESRVVMLDTAGSGTAIDMQFSPGRHISPYQGAMGRAYAAARGERAEDLADILSLIPWQNRPTDAELNRQIDEAGHRGYGVDRDNLFRGLTSVAVPVRAEDGSVVLFVSGIGLSSNLDDKRLVALAEDLAASAAQVKTLEPMIAV